MKRWPAAAVGAVWLLAAAVGAQRWEEPGPDLESFYGARSFQQITVGAAPYLLPGGGMLGEVTFAFNTLSRRAQPQHWLNYYGAALAFAGAQDVAFDFPHYGDAKLDAWYGCLLIQGKWFYSDRGRVRPYFGLEGGAGGGGFSFSGLDDEVDAPAIPRLTLIRLGVEAGVHIALGERVALVIADTPSAYFGIMEHSQFFVFPNTIYVGISIWKGLSEMERGRK